MISVQRSPFAEWQARLRARGGQRLAAIVLTLLVELVLILAILSLGLTKPAKPPAERSLVSVNVAPEPKAAPDQAKPEASKAARPLQQARPTPPLPLPKPLAVKPPPAIIPVTRSQMAELDIANLPRTPSKPASTPAYGPPDRGVPGDSKRVGSAPNGEPMYAAAWYREPYHDELSGYLSTASGPGWALIACRTVPDFKVDDCVGLDEYPSGSQIQRAVLAAAWQFKVRPPRVGGVSKVGEWVRIRIDYGIERRR